MDKDRLRELKARAAVEVNGEVHHSFHWETKHGVLTSDGIGQAMSDLEDERERCEQAITRIAALRLDLNEELHR